VRNVARHRASNNTLVGLGQVGCVYEEILAPLLGRATQTWLVKKNFDLSGIIKIATQFWRPTYLDLSIKI